MIPFRLGRLDLAVLETGRFRLDGGAMFGVVPKPLWERLAPADERNRVTLALNCLLIRGPDRPTILVDTGAGQKWDAKGRDIYAVEEGPGVAGELRKTGLSPDDIEVVLNTHLHFDHAGGNTFRDATGALRLAFPRARHLVQRGNLFEEALAPNEIRHASYLPENFEPVRKAGRLDLLEGDGEIAPGVRVIVTGGHQKFHQVVLVESEGERAAFLGDLVPTTAHLNPSFIMSYDHYPLETLARKKELLGRAAGERWLVILEHEPRSPLGRVVREGARFRWEPWEGGADSGTGTGTGTGEER